jgi:hypothetical protein
VVVFSFTGGDRLVVWLVVADLEIYRLALDGEAQLPVKAGQTSVMVDDGGVFHRYLVKGIISAACVSSPGLLWEKS